MTNLAFNDLVPGKPRQVEVDGKPVCVARVGDEVFAVSNICTHSYAELSDGEIDGFKIECWLHGADFDLRTGEALTLPATEALESYDVERRGDEVFISPKTKEN
jgi:3-phenylpropionate/trans-cinnamate dioxygenase ferredoxin subunit